MRNHSTDDPRVYIAAHQPPRDPPHPPQSTPVDGRLFMQPSGTDLLVLRSAHTRQPPHILCPRSLRPTYNRLTGTKIPAHSTCAHAPLPAQTQTQGHESRSTNMHAQQVHMPCMAQPLSRCRRNHRRRTHAHVMHGTASIALPPHPHTSNPCICHAWHSIYRIAAAHSSKQCMDPERRMSCDQAADTAWH